MIGSRPTCTNEPMKVSSYRIPNPRWSVGRRTGHGEWAVGLDHAGWPVEERQAAIAAGVGASAGRRNVRTSMTRRYASHAAERPDQLGGLPPRVLLTQTQTLPSPSRLAGHCRQPAHTLETSATQRERLHIEDATALTLLHNTGHTDIPPRGRVPAPSSMEPAVCPPTQHRRTAARAARVHGGRPHHHQRRAPGGETDRIRTAASVRGPARRPAPASCRGARLDAPVSGPPPPAVHPHRRLPNPAGRQDQRPADPSTHWSPHSPAKWRWEPPSSRTSNHTAPPQRAIRSRSAVRTAHRGSGRSRLRASARRDHRRLLAAGPAAVEPGRAPCSHDHLGRQCLPRGQRLTCRPPWPAAHPAPGPDLQRCRPSAGGQASAPVTASV
ncbi:hypothetical protein SPILM97S_06717 [Streptomyces pilosus]